MSIFDEIINHPNKPGPIAAYLVGREQKRQRDRQERQDQLDERNVESAITTRERTADRLDSEQKSRAKERATLAKERADAARVQQEQNTNIARQIALNPAIPNDVKPLAISAILNGQADDGLDMISDYVKPGENDDGSFTLSPGGKRYDKDGKVIADNPSNKAASVPSVTTGERQAALALVKQDDEFGDLSANDREIAADFLASEVKRLKRIEGLTHAEAIIVAKDSLREKVKQEPGFLFGSNPVIDFDGKVVNYEDLQD